MSFRTTLVVATAALLPLGQAGNAWAQAGLDDGAVGRPVPAEAGSVYETRGPLTYGTFDQVSHTLQAFGFAGFAASDEAVFAGTAAGARYCTSADCFFVAPVRLPAGASIESIELEACDTNASAEVTMALFQNVTLEGGTFFLATTSTGFADTPGCDFFTAILTTPHTVDNFVDNYMMQVSSFGTSSTTRFQAVRIFYRLQVSPAPATATFTDVPTTHPFFRQVEALVASGITSGCGGGAYCPDNPVTRGQMAVFLSTALGLHFPN